MVISLLFSVLHDEVLFLFSGMEAVLFYASYGRVLFLGRCFCLDSPYLIVNGGNENIH